MPEFKSEHEAKEFLVKCIVDQAEREGKPLTEVERKMLYFSETGWTLPDILEVNAAFERDYDEGEYEQKIAGLADNLRNSQQDTTEWDAALEKLAEGDHYLLYLIDSRFGGTPIAGAPGSPLRLVFTAFVVLGILTTVAMFLVNSK